jgi:hypothetical protein
MKNLLHSTLSIGLCAGLLAGTPIDAQAQVVRSEVALAATVLTLEGGVVGLQHLLHFTPLQLGGALCDAPNRCQPVDYFAMPLGQAFNDLGAIRVNEAISDLPDDGTPITLFGHSQGGQVIYSALRGWAAEPGTAPDPARVSWVSIGNPENTFGGRDPDPLPADSPYPGIEVIRQYDGWADWPTGPFNLVAWANAAVGMSTTHVFGYFDVDIDDPNNIRYTPDRSDGTPGNITYVFVPTPTLPLVTALTGPLAPLLNPVLDPLLRPMVEAGYNRPITVPGGGAGSAATAPTVKPSAALTPARSRVASAAKAPALAEPAQAAPAAAALDAEGPAPVAKKPRAERSSEPTNRRGQRGS